MPSSTRHTTVGRILDAAQALIDRQGFAATSIDQILREVELTKGAFFHHFKSKQELARALIDRFAATDQEILTSSMERAERLSDDPLQQVLLFVGLLTEVAEQLDANPQPGCLFATYCFESGLFDEDTRQVVADAIENWRTVLATKLNAAARLHPPAPDVDLESLADMLTVLFEGAFVLARTFPGRSVFAQQLRHYRRYVQSVFAD